MIENKTTTKEKPIYILGLNAVGLYLASKFQLGGERVIVLTDKRDEGNLSGTDFNIKEDSGIKKGDIRFTTSFWTKEEGKLVIIASNPQDINADIFRLGKEKLAHCPTVCVSLCEDITLVKRSLETNVIQVWFDGWINRKSNHIFAYGKIPELIFYSLPEKETSRKLEKLFSPSGIKFNNDTPNESKKKLYCYMGCSLACAVCGKNINQIFKNKSDTALLEQYFKEISSVSEVEKSTVSTEKLLEMAKSTPANYTFPLIESLNQNRSGEYSFFCDYILRYSRRNDCNVEHLAQGLKKIYHTYLSIT